MGLQNYHVELTDKCGSRSKELNKVDEDILRAYSRVREECLKEDNRSPAISNIPTESYTWSTNFSGPQEYSVVRLDDNTVVYSSRYFPSKVAKVIISGDIIIFVYYDGQVTMKPLNCLGLNEKILIKGIKKIKTDGKKSFSLFAKDEGALKSYLASHKINEENFYDEQLYIKIWTKRDIEILKKVAMQKPTGITIDFRDEFKFNS